jgi:hypothetical protein
MVISNKKEAMIVMLHFNKILHCTQVITQMQITCRSYATNNNLFIHTELQKNGLKNEIKS